MISIMTISSGVTGSNNKNSGRHKIKNHLINCYGVIFLLHRIKWELNFFIKHIAIIALGAFLCAIGGIILWINGGSGWYVLNSLGNSNHTFSLTAVFIIWLLAYAIYGSRLAAIASGEGISCSDAKRSLTGFCLTAFAYLLDLVWYTVFFCTRLTWFALIILLLSLLLNIFVILLLKRWIILQIILNIASILVQIYFIWLNLSLILFE